MGMIEESFFFPKVKKCARKLNIRVDRDEPVKQLREMKKYKSLCRTCNGRVHQNSRVSCVECDEISCSIETAIQARHHIAKICPDSKSHLSTEEQCKDIIENWKNLVGRLILRTDINTSTRCIQEEKNKFDEAFTNLFWPEGCNFDPQKVNNITRLFFTCNKYINKMAVKVVFRNKLMPIVEKFLKRNPKIKVPPKEPHRDEELEKTEALGNSVHASFFAARKIRNDLQYEYTIEPLLCGKALDTMKDLVEKLVKGSSKDFYTESKQLFTPECFPPLYKPNIFFAK
jgi:hypothetical protein